jgi:hypothetical protein
VELSASVTGQDFAAAPVRLLLAAGDEPDAWRIAFTGIAGRLYRLDAAAALLATNTPWTTQQFLNAGADGAVAFEILSETPARFFRVQGDAR